MERMIFFGSCRSYLNAEGVKSFLVDYMTEDGITHRDFITNAIFNKIAPYNIVPGTFVVGVFECDAFNKLSLIDLKQ